MATIILPGMQIGVRECEALDRLLNSQTGANYIEQLREEVDRKPTEQTSGDIVALQDLRVALKKLDNALNR